MQLWILWFLTMNVQCINCKRIDLRSDPKMTKVGFARCELAARWQYKSVVWPRECAKHVPVEKETAQKRVDWYQKQKVKVEL